MGDNTKKVAKEVTSHIIKSIQTQDDPKNRVVTEVQIVHDDYYDIDKIYVVSNCDGWAEDTKYLCEGIFDKPTFEKLESMVGKSEYSFLSLLSLDSDKKNPRGFNELCRALDRLFNSNTPVSSGEEYEEQYFESSPESEYAELCACGELINGDGSCNWDNMLRLKRHGYVVYAGEKDSFGWLTGCIKKLNGDDRRVLVYG